MSKLNNFYNIEKESLGEVFELPKQEVKPFTLIIDADNEIFNQITNLTK